MKETPLGSRESYAIRNFFGFIHGFRAEAPKLKFRLESVDRWDMVQECLAKAELILQDILPTIPLNKRKLMLKDLDNTTVEIKVIRDFTGQKKSEFVYVPAHALDRMVNRVINDNCLFCDKTAKESKKCPIRMDADELYPWELPPNGELCPMAGMMMSEED
jgi:hypothetical protein